MSGLGLESGMKVKHVTAYEIQRRRQLPEVADAVRILGDLLKVGEAVMVTIEDGVPCAALVSADSASAEVELLGE